MFKAKLIDNPKYYKYKYRAALLLFLGSLLGGLMPNLFSGIIWITVLALVIFIALLFYTKKNNDSLNSFLGNKRLEIDENEIRITSKNGIQHASYSLEAIEKLVINEDYGMPDDSIKDISMKPKMNYLKIFQKQGPKRLDFEIDSYYMTTQLEKLINAWKNKGYHIEFEKPLEAEKVYW